MPESPNTTNSASDSKTAEGFKTAMSPSMGKASPQSVSLSLTQRPTFPPAKDRKFITLGIYNGKHIRFLYVTMSVNTTA